MKPLILAFPLFCSVFAKGVFTQTKAIDPVIIQAFSLSYGNAKNVDCSQVNTLYKAEFNLNDATATVFYNTKGDAIAATRVVTSSQLPLPLQQKLERKYKNYKVTALFEVATEEGSCYYATIENAKAIITLKSIANEKWSIYTKAGK